MSLTTSLSMSLMMALTMALAGCQAQAPLKPFTTDGCSMFPDRAPLKGADWCSCCLVHDLAYWQGGSAEQRLEADRDLAACVKTQARSSVLARVMLAGVRLGGHAALPTSYRWGYGWPYGRMYRQLSADEQSQAATLRADYLATNPGLVCSAPGSHAGPLLQTVTHW